VEYGSSMVEMSLNDNHQLGKSSLQFMEYLLKSTLDKKYE